MPEADYLDQGFEDFLLNNVRKQWWWGLKIKKMLLFQFRQVNNRKFDIVFLNNVRKQWWWALNLIEEKVLLF